MSKALAESGADVALMYVSSENTHKTASEIAKQYGVVCKAYKANITDAKQVQDAISQIHQDFKAIDIFVANAGVNSGGPSEVSFYIVREKREWALLKKTPCVSY